MESVPRRRRLLHNEAVRGLFRIIVLLAAALLTGCGDESAQNVRDWTFTGPTESGAPVTLPVHLEARLPRERSAYVLRSEVPLAPSLQGHDLVLVIPKFFGRCTLLAGDRPATSIQEGENVGYRARGPHAWRIPAAATASGVLRLELDVEHTWTRSAWLDTVPRLTTAPDGGRAFVLQRGFNEISADISLCVAFAGYLYLIVYLTDRRRTAYGWFALTGLTGLAYPLFANGLIAPMVGPWETVILGTGVVVATGAEIPFTAAHFGEPRPSRLWLAFGALAVAVLIGSVGYFRSTQVGGPATIVFAGPAILSQVVLLVRLARRRPRPPTLWTVLGGWAVLAFLAIPDFGAWGGLGELLAGTSTACMGISLIALLQTATISRAHTNALREADELAQERQERIRELEAQKREVEQLNDELRRQVGARSRELASAISRLSGSPNEATLGPGDVIDDRYEVVRPIGAGAGGSVYLVKRRADGVELAMKVVSAGNDRNLVARLAREAHLVAEVKHDNVISIVDVDVAASGFLYIVMEYVAGKTLRDHKGDFGRIGWAIDVLAQIAAGLASVHERGIVHRDLKPANVLLVTRADGELAVKIADFGIAGVAGVEGDEEQRTLSVRCGSSNDWQTRADSAPTAMPLELTQTGVLLGTPLYMAPETIGGAKNATPSVDLFSFGVIAYEILSGAPPFSESPALAQLRGHTVPVPPFIGSVVTGVPLAVSRLVERCLAFEPEERPTAAEAVRVLTEVRAEHTA